MYFIFLFLGLLIACLISAYESGTCGGCPGGKQGRSNSICPKGGCPSGYSCYNGGCIVENNSGSYGNILRILSKLFK